MTRKEEIYNVARQDLNKLGISSIIKDEKGIFSAYGRGFVEGAEWADNHPRKLYVVTRCEEHSDYVEKVFVDGNKAINYCKQFEGNEDAYGRDITEIDITLWQITMEE